MKASECKCCECGKQAVAFYPVIDPDIPSYPYCRACLDKMKMELAKKIWGDDSEMLAIAKEVINDKKNRHEQKDKYDFEIQVIHDPNFDDATNNKLTSTKISNEHRTNRR